MVTEREIKKVLNLCKLQPPNVPLDVFTEPYEVLISTVMSPRTNDDTTLPAARRLFEKAGNATELSKLSEEEIAALIYPVGFYKTKAKNIKKLAQQLVDEHDGKVPDNKDELIKLAGVGSKTANLVLNRVFGVPAISVDTHVHFISNLLGWVSTKNPEQTEEELMKIVPPKYWSDINFLFVSTGRNLKTRKKVEQFFADNGLIAT